VKALEDIKILVIGDIMLDKYVLGEVERISPEAPVPIVHVYDEYSTLGGCGNVARNIKELGPQVVCLSSIAKDDNGKIILEKLKELDVVPLLYEGAQTTITKERVIASERKIQMIRIDREIKKDIEAFELIPMLEKEYDLQTFDIIVISDYAKGVITEPLMHYLNDRNIKYIVDPKPRRIGFYGYPYLITPNEKEAKAMGGAKGPVLNVAEFVLETKGKRGMTLHGKKQFWTISADEVEVYNVSGAGDTVIAVMATALSMGWNPLDSAYIANKCASYVVTKPGTSTVPKSMFMKLLKEYKKGNY
jgi:rfaE bifunctional protein kinase chain/domain